MRKPSPVDEALETASTRSAFPLTKPIRIHCSSQSMGAVLNDARRVYPNVFKPEHLCHLNCVIEGRWENANLISVSESIDLSMFVDSVVKAGNKA